MIDISSQNALYCLLRCHSENVQLDRAVHFHIDSLLATSYTVYLLGGEGEVGGGGVKSGFPLSSG